MLSGLGLAAGSGAADIPDYARAALAAFNPSAPTRWAYTLTTRRNDREVTERFDPALPPDNRWTLLATDGHPPSADETAAYGGTRSGGQSMPQAPFQPADIDPASLVLVREDAERGEFTATFTAPAVHGDRMLGHLQLHLTIARQNPGVEKYTLVLQAPYTPVIGVKMHQLNVVATFAPPSVDRPSLPATCHSVFSGRIFFLFSIEENLKLTYADFARRPCLPPFSGAAITVDIILQSTGL